MQCIPEEKIAVRRREADTKEPLSLKGFARHLAEHGKLVDYPMAVLVLQNIVACLKEMVTQGQGN